MLLEIYSSISIFNETTTESFQFFKLFLRTRNENIRHDSVRGKGKQNPVRIDDHQPLTREDKKNQIAKRHWFTRQRSIYSRRAFASCCIYLANYLSRPFPYCSPRNITDEFDKNHACAVLCTNLISAHCPFLTFDHIDKQQRHQSTQQLPIRGTMFLAKLFLAGEKKNDRQKNFSPLSHREAFSHFVGVASGRHRELQKCIREVEASNMAIINRNWSNRFQYENCSFRL